MELTWWEKTVEYFFIRNCVGDSMLIAPLDGSPERAGDSIFSRDNSWVLIEFKRDEASLKSEEDKFTSFDAAQGELKGKDGHHFLVYGGMFQSDNGEDKFGVTAQTYFARDRVTKVDNMLSSGVGFDEFFEYIKKFTSFKKSKSGSGGGLGLETYGLVAGINENNQIVECLSLAEMGNQLGVDLTPENTPAPEPSSPSSSHEPKL